MSPRAQAAAISGGRMLRTCASVGLRPASSIAYSRWKWLVDTNGVATFLPFRSATLVMPLPSRATSASAAPMSSSIQNISMSRPWLIAVAIGALPASPSCTSPDAIARMTSPPPPNCRQLIL